MTKPSKPAVVIKEIKRVWEPGMTAREVSAALNPKLKISRGTVCNYFRNFEDQLAPCCLPKPTRKPKPKEIDQPLYGETYRLNGITLPKVFKD